VCVCVRYSWVYTRGTIISYLLGKPVHYYFPIEFFNNLLDILQYYDNRRFSYRTLSGIYADDFSLPAFFFFLFLSNSAANGHGENSARFVSKEATMGENGKSVIARRRCPAVIRQVQCLLRCTQYSRNVITFHSISFTTAQKQSISRKHNVRRTYATPNQITW